jgi:hypothetical protein
VIIAVAAVIVVQVPLNDVVGVVAMRRPFVPAIGAVPVLCVMSSALVLRSTGIRIGRVHSQRMFIHVVAVDVVQMAIVKIIGVAIVHHALMSAAGIVLVGMLFV